MTCESNSNLKIFPSEGSFDPKTTLSRAITEYLKTCKNRDEKSVLNQFREYMQNKRPNVHIQDIKVQDFKSFVESLSISPTTKKSYASRFKHFQEYIGLSEVKVKKKRNPKNDQAVILELKKELAKTEKEVAEKQKAVDAHNKTIDGQNTQIKTMTDGRTKECSQCPKIAPLSQKNEADKDTFDKEIEKYRVTIDGQQRKINRFVSNSGKIEEIQQLEKQFEAKKVEKEREIRELDEQITKGEKIMENQQIVKVRCPIKSNVHYGSIVSFGNDCRHCEKDYVSCPKYSELTNPDRA